MIIAGHSIERWLHHRISYLRIAAAIGLASAALIVIQCATSRQVFPNHDKPVNLQPAAISNASTVTIKKMLINTTRKPVESMANRRAVAPWLQHFDDATDLRAFAWSARTQASAGGVFYALMALRDCRVQWPDLEQSNIDTQALNSTDHRSLWIRDNHIDRAVRRCASFSKNELDEDAVGELSRIGESADDPIMGIYRTWLAAVESGDLNLISEALTQIFTARDPFLLEIVGVTGAFYLSPFGSADLSDETTRRRFIDAWRLVPCEFGMPCDENDRVVQELCLRTGQCLSSRFAAVAFEGKWFSSDDQQSLIAATASIVDAIKRGDSAVVLNGKIEN